MPLYTYADDPREKPTCVTQPCTDHWAPYQAAQLAKPLGDFSVVDRGDGLFQWAFKGKPLYSYDGDTEPGDANGNRLDGKWHAATVVRNFVPGQVAIARNRFGGYNLVSSQGMTLYVRDRVVGTNTGHNLRTGSRGNPMVGKILGTKSCDAECAKTWIPLIAPADAQPSGYWDVALRDDGKAIAGMGADLRDIDNDGRPDLVESGMINDSFQLFRNLGRDRGFEEYGLRTGLLLATRQLTGWGLGIYDFDNDGWKDIFFATAHFTELGRFIGRDSALPNRVFRNVGGTRFVDVSAGAGPAFQVAGLHRGVAFADFDNDGRVDAVVTQLNGPARLFHNITAGDAHWLAVELRGTRSNRQGLGATVHVRLPDGRDLYNHATTAVGYGSSSEPLVRFGLGANREAEELEIRWPGGGTQKIAHVPADGIVKVTEENQR